MRRLVSILLVAATICLLTPAVFAHDEPIIVPCAEVCGVCNRGTLITTYEWKPWLKTGEYRTCSNFFNKSDYRQVRLGLAFVRCNYCGTEAEYSTREYRWFCPHI